MVPGERGQTVDEPWTEPVDGARGRSPGTIRGRRSKKICRYKTRKSAERFQVGCVFRGACVSKISTPTEEFDLAHEMLIGGRCLVGGGALCKCSTGSLRGTWCMCFENHVTPHPRI